jgi:hypothetical protein
VLPNAAPDAFVTSYRIVGDAKLSIDDAVPTDTPLGSVMQVSFDVQSFTPGATLVLLGIYAEDNTGG